MRMSVRSSACLMLRCCLRMTDARTATALWAVAALTCGVRQACQAFDVYKCEAEALLLLPEERSHAFLQSCREQHKLVPPAPLSLDEHSVPCWRTRTRA